MTRDWLRGAIRWMAVAASVAVAFVVSVYVNLFVFLFGPFPRDLAEPTAGFVMGALVVLPGALLAPRFRLVVAAVLVALITWIGVAVFRQHVAGPALGGLAAAAFAMWWLHPRRTARVTRGVAAAAAVAGLAFAGLVYARHVDWPARPDALPALLAEALGSEGARVQAFYLHDLGGFIDHEWLWRIDAPPELVARAVSGLGLEPAGAVPPRFWRMPPHYWPRAMPGGGKAFRSPRFPDEGRGGDGEHFFLVHDRRQGRVFVWLRSNF